MNSVDVKDWATHQLSRVHVVQDPFSILAVSSAFHNGQQQLGRVVLEFQNQIHPGTAQRVDVIQEESRDDVKTVGLVGSDTVLVVMARTLAKDQNQSSKHKYRNSSANFFT